MTLFLLVTIWLLACSGTLSENSLKSAHANSTLISAKAAESDYKSNDKEPCLCHFDSILNHPETPKLAKDIYLDRDWNIGNDAEMLALLDSLTTSNQPYRAFYFKVVTKTEKKSDGYYTEGLAYAGYHFVLNHTAEFAAYFDERSCHTSKDLTTWATIVAMELAMNGEGTDLRKNRDEYIRRLNANCTLCSTKQQETIRDFSRALKKAMK